MSVKKYKVYCNDEAAFVTGWSESEPTTCYNNNTHIIDTDKTAMIDIQNSTNVRILQTHDSTEDIDNYYLYSKIFTIDPNETKDLMIDLDIDYNLYSVSIATKKENTGDRWSSYINKNTLIGVVAETSSGTSIKMAESSVEVVKPGYYVHLSGVDYMVIDKTIDTIILKNPIDVTIGDLVYMTFYMVYRQNIMDFGVRRFGDSIIGSFKIPKEYQMGVTYENNSSSTKTIVVESEMTF